MSLALMHNFNDNLLCISEYVIKLWKKQLLSSLNEACLECLPQVEC